LSACVAFTPEGSELLTGDILPGNVSIIDSKIGTVAGRPGPACWL